MKLFRNHRTSLGISVGILLLAIWLILTGLSVFVNLGDVRRFLDILAIAAGVLLLLRL